MEIDSSQEEKLKAAFDFYDELLGTASDREFTIDFEELGLPQLDLLSLEEPFIEEVWATIQDLPPDKAPGPDRFTGCFYRAWWEIIKICFWLLRQCIVVMSLSLNF